MFRNSSAMVINKIDLLPFVDTSLSELRANALKVNPHLKVFDVSCRDGSGIREWCSWLQEISGYPR
jgi:hydrogenase nickel incorporation protein HypB